MKSINGKVIEGHALSDTASGVVSARAWPFMLNISYGGFEGHLVVKQKHFDTLDEMRYRGDNKYILPAVLYRLILFIYEYT